MSGSASTDVVITLDNFEIVVTYIDGPTISLSPTGGQVEQGQSITVSSPTIDVQELEYAALDGDSVIPLIPKKNPDGTVTLEVPTPDESCLDCFGDCPNCEDCLDACANDLDSEACQNCMDACLECLTDCTESPEFAEACFESLPNPDPDTPIVIICSSPGNQFDGSVILGNFIVVTFEGSGIYTLVPGKTNDTLYSSARNGSTYDVKIPNPFGKSGFFKS